MSELFLKIVNMSISATWLVLAVLLLRLVLKKAPRWSHVLLWGLVGFRLICPFTLESALSLIPSAQTISPEIMMDATPEIHTGIESVNRVVNPVITEAFAPEPIASANPLQILIPIAALVWSIGMAVMVLYTLLTYWRLRRKVRLAIRVKDNIYLSEAVSSPFVLGIFRPRIYLPYHMAELDRYHVIAHERTHIRRKDHWWKPLGFALLTVHWFNPLLWLAYVLLCRDIELACDEKVVGNMRPEQRANYSQALLNCSIDRRSIAACPLAFGEVGVKERVRNVLRYRKPAFWVILMAVIVCITVAVCFLTDPKTPAEMDNLMEKTYEVTEILYQDPRYSFTYIPGSNAPTYGISTEGHLLSKNEHSGSDVWTDLGHLEPTELTKENFDDLFYDVEYMRNRQSPTSLRRNNVQAWQVIFTTEEDRFQYHLLRQEDGTLYLSSGHADRNLIRWVMELEAGDESLWDLTMAAQNVTSTKATLVFYQANPTPGKFITGSDFSLERREGDQWISLPVPDGTAWTSIAYIVSDGFVMNLNWHYLYGTLPDGDYRIVKAIENEQTGESRVLYAEFTLIDPLLWLQSLSENDVTRIEYRDHHSGVDLSQQYTLYEGSNLKTAIDALKLFDGLSADTKDSQDIYGGGFELTLTMMDGTSHTLQNIGNRYLHIDGSCYEDTYNILNSDAWNCFIGTTYLPANESNWGIRIEVQSATTSDVLLLYHVKEYAKDCTVSGIYTLQAWKNGSWVDMERISPEQQAADHDIQNLSAQHIPLGADYGELPDGTYRIGKTFFNTSSRTEQTLYAEFTLPVFDISLGTVTIQDPGLTITAEELTDTQVVLYFHPDNSDSQWFYLNPYRMEQRTDSGWTPMSLIPEMQYATWSGVAEPIPTGGGLVIPWEWYYGTLSPGAYRVALDVTQEKEYAPEDVSTVYAEFTLPEGGIGPKSLEELAKGYSLEQAEIDGCLVMVDGDVRYNQQSWFDFVDLARTGESASARIVQHYSARDSEPSHTFIYDVAYDGNVYTLRWCMLGGQDGILEETYQYLRSFTGQRETESVEYDAYERWVLTNDNLTSYDQMWKSYASSQLNAIIPHQVIYSDLIWFPDHPEIPETLTQARLLIPEGQDLVIEDPAALQQLRALLANAEFLGYYPKTPDFGPELQITDTDGAITSMYVGMDSDMFELDGNCFDYGPGYDGYGSNNDIDLLWQILGLTEWTAPNVTKWPAELCDQYESYRETVQWAKENPPMNRMFIPLSPDWETDSITIASTGGEKTEITGTQRDKLWDILCYAPLDKYYGPELDMQAAYTVEFSYRLWDFTCRIYPIGEDEFYITRTIDHVRYTCTSPELAQAFEEALS